jgi:hypothetical protein
MKFMHYRWKSLNNLKMQKEKIFSWCIRVGLSLMLCMLNVTDFHYNKEDHLVKVCRVKQADK